MLVKNEIEKEIKKNHMFIRIDDVILLDNNYFIVQELEPYNICLANNTDLEVEIDEFNFEDNEIDKLQYEDDSERVNIQFNSDTIRDTKFNIENNVYEQDSNFSEINKTNLSLTELRKKRLAFYSKKK